MKVIKHIIAAISYFFGFGLFIGAPTMEEGLVVLVFLIPAVIIHYKFWFYTIIYTVVYGVVGTIAFFVGMGWKK